MDSQKNATMSEEILGINFDMGLKHALTQVVQQFVVAEKLPQYCIMRISMTAQIDETLCDFDNLDAFYGLYESLKINIEL